MACGSKHEYQWDKEEAISAKKYIILLLEWIKKVIDNNEVFPLSQHVKFPNNFNQIMKVLYERIVRVYSHIYHAHL